MAPKTNVQLLLSAQELVDSYGGNVSEASRASGVPRGTLQSRLTRLAVMAETGQLGFDPVLPGFSITETTTRQGAAGEVIGRTIKQAPKRGELFEVPSGHVVKGISAFTDASGRVVGKWVKTREGNDPQMVFDAFKDIFLNYAAPRLYREEEPAADLATVYLLPDLHLGMMAWAKEVGRAWDLRIAMDQIARAQADLVTATPPSEKAVIIVLGDYLHSDGYAPLTPTNKNVLDVDGRYPKVLRAGAKFLVDMVSLALRKHETVEVRVLPGNHDPLGAIAVALTLSAYFHDEPRVIVDDDPSYFWWWEFGVNFVGATHADTVKMEDLPLLMASRNPEAWGRTRYRVIFTGHIHHKQVREVGGVLVESLQSPVPVDAYHHKGGYGAGRSLTAVNLHKDRGEVGRMRVALFD